MPRFPPRGPHGRLFPRFDGTVKALRLPAVHPAAFRFLHLAVPRDHASFAPAVATCGNVGPGVGRPVSPSGHSSVETTGSPKFLGNPNSRLHMVSDPGRPNVPDRCRTLTWPPRPERRRRRRENFRGSIAWLSGSPPTYHALVSRRRARLASRCWSSSPGRAFTRRVPKKGFQNVSYISSSFSKLLGTIPFSAPGVFSVRTLRLSALWRFQRANASIGSPGDAYSQEEICGNSSKVIPTKCSTDF